MGSQPLAGKHKEFCWWGKALKKCLYGQGPPPQVQHGLCHTKPMKASAPVTKKTQTKTTTTNNQKNPTNKKQTKQTKKGWANTVSSDSFHNSHFKEMPHLFQNGETSVSAKLLIASSEATCSTVRHHHEESVRFLPGLC